MMMHHAPLLVVRALLETPNQSARELAAALFNEPRTRTRERGLVHNAIGHLFAIGVIFESGNDSSSGTIARRYSVAAGIGPMTIDLALAQDLTLWQALLLSSPLGTQAEAS